ncbi:MAG TPA: ATP-binding protein [Syntrophales bacterium]|nr:ATP-binding protein [Syntrophales bacterium]HPQ43997.1 ATP-binding protein [Syntrophales bacterium]
MGTIPTSDMPGYQQLHDRVYSALDRCQESQAIDFKQSAVWDTLKWQLIRTVMAMGNLRDGGVIIIGASENDDDWELSGIEPDHLGTYDIDNIIDAINKYSSPPMQIEIVRIKYRNEKEFLAFQVLEFANTPYICKKNGPEKINLLCVGEVYIRPPGKPQTKKVTNAQEIDDLLELAAEKRARRMVETSRRIGFVPSQSSTQAFDDELEGL